MEQYRRSVKNIVSLLKPGGYYICVTALGCPFYVVGNEKFSCVPVTLEDVTRALNDADVDVIEHFEEQVKISEYSTELVGLLVLLGRKK